MGNELSGLTSHSAEYFGDTRDYWWNPDFLQLMAQRWGLHRVREVLDVGCGVGHWGRLIAGLLPEDARVTGVDREPLWIEKAAERAAARGQGERFRYQVAAVEALPFADGTFDMVTCQTVLIHTPDPGAALAEMIRVVKPGGLVAVVEPNNAASSLVFDAATFDAPVDDLVELVRLQLACERGKAALGEGNNSLGDRIPALFAAQGLADIQVYLSDKASTLLPPYDTAERRALVEEITEFAQRDFWLWSREDTRRYFLAGGGREDEFEARWAAALRRSRATAAAIAQGTYSSAGGSIAYLVSGTKPAPAR
jgi:SAM-dependent methyltransferase